MAREHIITAVGIALMTPEVLLDDIVQLIKDLFDFQASYAIFNQCYILFRGVKEFTLKS